MLTGDSPLLRGSFTPAAVSSGTSSANLPAVAGGSRLDGEAQVAAHRRGPLPITTRPAWKYNPRSGGSESCDGSHPGLFWGFRLSSPLTYLKGWLGAVSSLPL